MSVARAIAAGWLRLASNYFLDERVLGVSPMAELLWLRGLAYSKLNRLDGFVPRDALTVIGLKIGDTGPLVDELLKGGLWTERDGGMGVPADKWQDYQETREQEHERRAAAAERTRLSRERRAAHPDQQDPTGEP